MKYIIKKLINVGNKHHGVLIGKRLFSYIRQTRYLTIIVKGFNVNMQNQTCSFLNRRSFILAAILSPFITNHIFAESKIEEIDLFSSSNDEKFLILGGWVLLKDDLFEKVG